MGTWLNPIDRSITTKYRIGCTKFSILSLITLSKLQHFFAKFFKKQFPQRKYKVTYRICCYFFCCVCVSQQFLFLEVCVKTVFLQHDTTTTTHYFRSGGTFGDGGVLLRNIQGQPGQSVIILPIMHYYLPHFSNCHSRVCICTRK